MCKKAFTRTYVTNTDYTVYNLQYSTQHLQCIHYTEPRVWSILYIYKYPHYVVYMIHAIAEKNVPNQAAKQEIKPKNRGEPHCSTFGLAQTSFVSSGRWRPSQDVGSDSSDSRCGRYGVVKRNDSLKETSSYLWFPKQLSIFRLWQMMEKMPYENGR